MRFCNTRTLLNFALLRVALTLGLGYFFALPLPRLLKIDPHWGVAGLTLSAGMAGWVEFASSCAMHSTNILGPEPVSH